MTASFEARASRLSASVTRPGTSSLEATQTFASSSHSATTEHTSGLARKPIRASAIRTAATGATSSWRAF
jgi:hypothetical protein